MIRTRDQLEKQSLILITAALFGHVSNYAYHLITGRLLSENEYGLLMALFGVINLVLLPMSALGLALTRAVSADVLSRKGNGIRPLCRRWTLGLLPAALFFPAAALLAAPALQARYDFHRLAPLLLAALIPALNFFLTLSGSALQGLQQFSGLALRGSLLFVCRALLVGACLLLGWRAAGWALLAHLLGMLAALGVSVSFLLRALPGGQAQAAPPARPILLQTLGAMPVLLAFSTLMTADVILARRFFDPVLSGQFAQAATLGRMILWLPLPIAQVIFPKVVRERQPSPAQRHTLRKALGYTLLIILGTLGLAWGFAPQALQLVYGIAQPPAQQVAWFRGTALAMGLLGPVYLLMQYELARGKIRRLLPLCLIAPFFPLLSAFHHAAPGDLIRILIALNGAALLCGLWVLRRET